MSNDIQLRGGNHILKIISGESDSPVTIGDVEIECYVLEDETRVLSQRGLQRAMGISEGGGRAASDPLAGLFVGLKIKYPNYAHYRCASHHLWNFNPNVVVELLRFENIVIDTTKEVLAERGEPTPYTMIINYIDPILAKHGFFLALHTAVRVVWIRPLSEYRKYCPIQRDSQEWNDIYSKRTSVERVNSRLKEGRRLNSHCHRGLQKVRLHCLMSVLSLTVTSLADADAGNLERVRACTRRVN